mgnify:FL=1
MTNTDKNTDKQKPNMNPKDRKPKFSPYWVYAIIVLVFVGIQVFSGGWSEPAKTTPAEFQTFLKEGDVAKVVIVNKKKAKVFLTSDAKAKSVHSKSTSENVLATADSPSYVFEFGDLQNFENEIKKTKEEYNLSTSVVYDTESNVLGDVLLTLLPFAIIIAIWIFIMRRMSSGAGGGPGGQIFNIGKSKAKLFDQNTDVKTTFENVAGLEGAKEEVQEIVDFLKKPDKYTSLGGKIPKGALLVGPPGTGKTLLARAVAGEAKVPFFSLSGSDFVEMFVGGFESSRFV